MPITEFLAEQKRLTEAATPGPWAFAAAPAEGSDETAVEYLENALTGDGPLFVVWVPETQGEPEGYRLAAATGDGPHASMDAEFIAAARSSVPRMIAALEAVREILAPHAEWATGRLNRMGWRSECVCEQCRAWRAIEAALGGEGE